MRAAAAAAAAQMRPRRRRRRTRSTSGSRGYAEGVLDESAVGDAGSSSRRIRSRATRALTADGARARAPARRGNAATRGGRHGAFVVAATAIQTRARGRAGGGVEDCAAGEARYAQCIAAGARRSRRRRRRGRRGVGTRPRRASRIMTATRSKKTARPARSDGQPCSTKSTRRTRRPRRRATTSSTRRCSPRCRCATICRRTTRARASHGCRGRAASRELAAVIGVRRPREVPREAPARRLDGSLPRHGRRFRRGRAA